jgi:UrcA family protein
MKFISILTGFALLGSLSLSAIPAHASEFEQVSTKVYLGDLDLNSNTGAERAMSRIHRAARDVCGPDTDLRSFDTRREYDQCVAQAEDQAVAKLNIPQVTAANTHGGRPIQLASKSR